VHKVGYGRAVGCVKVLRHNRFEILMHCALVARYGFGVSEIGHGLHLHLMNGRCHHSAIRRATVLISP